MSGEPETVSPTLLLAIELFQSFDFSNADMGTEAFFDLHPETQERWLCVAREVEAKTIRAVEDERAGAPLSIELSEHERLLREAVCKAKGDERVEELERAVVKLAVLLAQANPQAGSVLVPMLGRVT